MWGLATQRVASSLSSTLPNSVSAALLGAGACRLRGLASKAEPVGADIEFEMDRDDPDLVDKKSLWEAPRAAPLEPVDLDTEFDRDDPELADKSNLWDSPRAQMEPVDLEVEFDRDDPEMADKRSLWECPEPPCPADIDAELDLMEEGEKAAPRAGAGMTEPKPTVPGESPAGTLAGNTPFGQEKKAPA